MYVVLNKINVTINFFNIINSCSYRFVLYFIFVRMKMIFGITIQHTHALLRWLLVIREEFIVAVHK